MTGDLPRVLEKTLGRLAVEQLLPAQLKASMQEALKKAWGDIQGAPDKTALRVLAILSVVHLDWCQLSSSGSG